MKKFNLDENPSTIEGAIHPAPMTEESIKEAVGLLTEPERFGMMPFAIRPDKPTIIHFLTA